MLWQARIVRNVRLSVLADRRPLVPCHGAIAPDAARPRLPDADGRMPYQAGVRSALLEVGDAQLEHVPEQDQDEWQIEWQPVLAGAVSQLVSASVYGSIP